MFRLPVQANIDPNVIIQYYQQLNFIDRAASQFWCIITTN